jgi:hypothetical protein
MKFYNALVTVRSIILTELNYRILNLLLTVHVMGGTVSIFET